MPKKHLNVALKTEIFAENYFRNKEWLICTSYKTDKSKIRNNSHNLNSGLDIYTGNYNNILFSGDFDLEFSES